jgi:hypothetical protein
MWRNYFQVPEEKIDDTNGIIRSVDIFLIVIFKRIQKSLKYMEMFNNYTQFLPHS